MDEQDLEERPEQKPLEGTVEPTEAAQPSAVLPARELEASQELPAAVQAEDKDAAKPEPEPTEPARTEPEPAQPAATVIEVASEATPQSAAASEDESTEENVEADSAPEPMLLKAPELEAVEHPAAPRITSEMRGGKLPQAEVTSEAAAEAAWYVIHCYSGYENKVRHNLEQRIETMGMKDRIFDVVIPTQEEIEVREGKRRTVERHIFPGYVLVNMTLSEESWYVVRNTPGVTGFVGMGNLPTALRPEEVSQIIKRMEADAPTVKVSFKVGERVRIVDGPFNDFRGTVSDLDMERTKVRVMVSFFGRETPVELDFLQVEKA